MPHHKAVSTLRMLSIKSIAENMEALWSVNYTESLKANNTGKFSFLDGPFNSLLSDDIQEILNKLSTGRLLKKSYLELLVVPTLRKIDFSKCHKFINDDIVDVMCLRCKGMTIVNVNWCVRVSPQHLTNMVKTFQSTLTHLSLDRTKVSNDLMEELANCKNLKVLSINMCRVKKHQLHKVIFDSTSGDITPAGHSLAVLRMDGIFFDGDIDFIIKVLSECPDIHEILHGYVWDAIWKICKENPELSPMKLKVAGGNVLGQFQDHCSVLPYAVRCLPHLSYLSIHHARGMEIPAFNVIVGFCNNLKSLDLDWVYPIHFLQYMGSLCPNLEKLVVYIAGASNLREDINLEVNMIYQTYARAHAILDNDKSLRWSKLKDFAVFFSDSCDERSQISFNHFLCNIVFNASATLSSLLLAQIPDKELNSLIAHALDAGCLYNLESFSICKSRNFNLSLLWSLVLQAPKLNRLSVSQCYHLSESDIFNVRQFVKKNNYDIQLLYKD